MPEVPLPFVTGTILFQKRMVMVEPTIAEENFAKNIAFWHGQTPLYRKDGLLITVANSHSMEPTGWAWEVDRYVDRHWKEYIHAARAVLAMR